MTIVKGVLQPQWSSMIEFKVIVSLINPCLMKFNVMHFSIITLELNLKKCF